MKKHLFVCVTHLQVISALNEAYRLYKENQQIYVDFCLLYEEGDLRKLSLLSETIASLPWVTHVYTIENKKQNIRLLRYSRYVFGLYHYLIKKILPFIKESYSDIYWYQNQKIQKYIKKHNPQAIYHMLDEGVGCYVHQNFSDYDEVLFYAPEFLTKEQKQGVQVRALLKLDTEILSLLKAIYKPLIELKAIQKKTFDMIFFDQPYGRLWLSDYVERKKYTLDKVQEDALKNNWSLIIRPHPACQKKTLTKYLKNTTHLETDFSKVPFELELALGLIQQPKVIGTISSSAAFYWMFMLDHKQVEMPHIYFYYSVLDLFAHKDPHPEMRTFITKLCEKFPEKVTFVKF